MPLHLHTPFDPQAEPDDEKPLNGFHLYSTEPTEELFGEGEHTARGDRRRTRELQPALAPRPDLPRLDALLGRKPHRHWWGLAADCCYIVIKSGAYLAAIYLAVLGLPLLFFLALAGGDMEVLFAQLGNLSAHFLAADPAGQAAFASGIKLSLFGTATLIAIWRMPRFLNEISTVLDPREQDL